MADRDGTVWAGTWGGGLAHFDGKTFRNYTVPTACRATTCSCCTRRAKGELWIGTNNGLASTNGDKFETLTTADGLFSNTVFSMDSGSDGTLWVGSFGGVARLSSTEKTGK